MRELRHWKNQRTAQQGTSYAYHCCRLFVASICMFALNNIFILHNTLSKKNDMNSYQESHRLLLKETQDIVDETAAKSQSDYLFLSKKYSNYQYVPPDRSYTDVLQVECGNAPDFINFFEQSYKGRSANNEDHDLYTKIFSAITLFGQGTYLEMGAFDGIQESNSRFFDACLDWKGLLIEPNPSMYPTLIGNRKNAHKMSFAPSCSVEEEALNKMVGFPPYPLTNATTAGTKNDTGKSEVQVPCGSLTPVLLDLFGGRVTLFSLDVEGAEPMVLENIDFSRVRFDVVIVKNRNQKCQEECESRNKARSLMAAAGYLLQDAMITKSDLYLHPDVQVR